MIEQAFPPVTREHPQQRPPVGVAIHHNILLSRSGILVGRHFAKRHFRVGPNKAIPTILGPQYYCFIHFWYPCISSAPTAPLATSAATSRKPYSIPTIDER